MVRLTKYLILFIALSLQTGLAQSDNKFIDSLLFRLESAPANEKINVLNDISRAYWQVSLDHSLKYAGEALKLAMDLDNKSGIADAYNRLGNAEYLMANYNEAIEHYKISLRLRLDIDDRPGILGSYNNLYLVHDISGNRKEAHDFIEKALELSISLEDKSEIARYSNILGSIQSELHEFDDAQASIERALNIYQTIEDNNGIAASLNNMGSMYNRMSLYDQAQESFFRALMLYRETGNMSGVASAKNNIGIIHKQLNHLDVALDYFRLSLEIYNEQGGARRGVASLLNNIGIIWFEKGDYESALDYYTRALDIYEEIRYIQGVATITHNKGILLTRLGNHQDALESYMRSVEINRSIGDNYSLANNYNNLGELYHLRNDFKKSLGFLEEALEMALSLNAKGIICENYLFQSHLFRDQNDHERSLLLYELYDTYRDSIFTIDTGNKIAELQVRNKREGQITELELLQKDNHIQLLQIRKQNNLLLYLGGLALLTGIFISGILAMYRYRRKLNLVLSQKTRQLEHANKELTISEKTLQKENATKDKFFSIIAHDLRNPFNALLGFSEMLNQNYKELSREQIYTYIDIINKSATNLYKLLENLLEWSKSQTGNIQYKPEKFQLKDIAETGINTVKVNAERKNINIKTDISSRLTAFADKNIISTVIRNLVNNAVKFTHHNGEISISARETEQYIELSVSDNGIGIETAEQKKLFNINYNVTTVGTSDERGTGLGLILCKEFVEKCGGELWLESEAGKGSKFTFTIPK